MKRNVKLQKLVITKFKGTLHQEIVFETNKTLIQGDNAQGKTTIWSAYSFLLTGKDQNLMAEYKYFKPVDENKEVIYPRDGYLVEGTFVVDCENAPTEEITLERTLRQKFSKARGESEDRMTGHTTEYKINGLDKTNAEFSAVIERIFGSEEVILLCSNINYFPIHLQSDTNKQRNILFTILPQVSDEQIVKRMGLDKYRNNDSALDKLRSYLSDKKELHTIRAEKLSKVRELTKKLKEIPAMIEATNSMRPELDGINFNKLDEELQGLNTEIKAIDKAIAEPRSKSKSELDAERKKNKIDTLIEQYKGKALEEYNKKNVNLAKQQNEYKSNINTMEWELKEFDKSIERYKSSSALTDARTSKEELNKKLSKLEEQKVKATNYYNSIQEQIGALEKDITELNKELDALRNQAVELMNKTFDKGSIKLTEGMTCTCCNRLIDADTIALHTDFLSKQFDNDKQEKMKRFNEIGLTKKGYLDEANKRLLLLQDDAQSKAMNISDTNNEIRDLKGKLDEVDKTIKDINDTLDTAIKGLHEVKEDDSDLIKQICKVVSSKKQKQADIDKSKTELSMLEELIRDNEEVYKESISNKNTQILAYENEKKELEVFTDEEADTLYKKNIEELESKRATLEERVTEVNQILGRRSTELKCNENIKLYEERMRTLSDEIATLEQEAMLVDDYNRNKVELVEGEIPKYFKYVSFQLFDELNNGELREVCNVLVDGKHFNKQLNSASCINAGIELVNAFQRHYGVFLPVFVDNKESVTSVQAMDCQTIYLEKVAGVSNLIISNYED